jgi:hypothetical protein
MPDRITSTSSMQRTTESKAMRVETIVHAVHRLSSTFFEFHGGSAAIGWVFGLRERRPDALFYLAQPIHNLW